jgi:Mrp family chromosome partitioning ATPase
MLAPMTPANNQTMPRTPTPTTAAAAQSAPPRVVGGTSSLETLARLPALGKPGHSTEEPSFADHIAAVDDASAAGYPGYREAIDQILAGLSAAATSGKPLVAMLVGTEAAAGTSSTALALAYRAAVSGRRTLLVDVSAADAALSHVFAANLQQRRACVLDSEAHLAEITLRDDRTGLSILPIALANLVQLDIEQQRRLVSGLRQIGRRFDFVVLDAGSATDNQAMAFLTAIVDKVLIVTARSAVSTGLTRLRAMETAQRFPTRSSAPAIVETSAA